MCVRRCALGELLVGVAERDSAETAKRFTARCRGVADCGHLLDEERALNPVVNIQLTERNQSAPAVQPVKRYECSCCQLTVQGSAGPGPLLCSACVHHYEVAGESIERQLARLGEHDQRMRASYVRARAAADEYRQQRDSAYRQRDDWREAAIKLVHDHYDSGKGRCVRCGQEFPCRPWKLLEELNRGFARRAETWACFTPEELERHLHPKRRRDADYHEDRDDVDDETG